MKWTIPAFLFVILCSIPVLGSQKFTSWGATYGNLANIVGLSFAFHNYLFFSSRPYPFPELKTIWSNFGLGAFLWLLAQSIETYCELILRLITYGTVADSLWLLGYVPILFGFYRILIFEMRRKNYKWTHFRALLIFAGIAYLMIFVFFIRQQLQSSNQRLSERILDFCYPTLDCILIVQCILIMKASVRSGPFYSFSFVSALAFLMTLVGDGVLSRITDFQSFFYLTTDIWYISCYFLMAIAVAMHYRRLKQFDHAVSQPT